jgi:hypothetical protein
MHRRTVRIFVAMIVGGALLGALWTTHTLAKTKGGCGEKQVCCRYVKDGMTELDCMDPKACADQGGKEIPDKSKCAE